MARVATSDPTVVAPDPRLLGWSMAGVGLARLTGLALDGMPDTRQIIWITAEVILAVGSALALRRLER